MSSHVNPLVGTWRILTFEMRGADGQVALRPLGERPTGYLLYSAEGYMSAAGSAPERTAATSPRTSTTSTTRSTSTRCCPTASAS